MPMREWKIRLEEVKSPFICRAYRDHVVSPLGDIGVKDIEYVKSEDKKSETCVLENKEVVEYHPAKWLVDKYISDMIKLLNTDRANTRTLRLGVTNCEKVVGVPYQGELGEFVEEFYEALDEQLALVFPRLRKNSVSIEATAIKVRDLQDKCRAVIGDQLNDHTCTEDNVRLFGKYNDGKAILLLPQPDKLPNNCIEVDVDDVELYDRVLLDVVFSREHHDPRVYFQTCKERLEIPMAMEGVDETNWRATPLSLWWSLAAMDPVFENRLLCRGYRKRYVINLTSNTSVMSVLDEQCLEKINMDNLESFRNDIAMFPFEARTVFILTGAKGPCEDVVNLFHDVMAKYREISRDWKEFVPVVFDIVLIVSKSSNIDDWTGKLKCVVSVEHEARVTAFLKSCNCPAFQYLDRVPSQNPSIEVKAKENGFVLDYFSGAKSVDWHIMFANAPIRRDSLVSSFVKQLHEARKTVMSTNRSFSVEIYKSHRCCGASTLGYQVLFEYSSEAEKFIARDGMLKYESGFSFKSRAPVILLDDQDKVYDVSLWPGEPIVLLQVISPTGGNSKSHTSQPLSSWISSEHLDGAISHMKGFFPESSAALDEFKQDIANKHTDGAHIHDLILTATTGEFKPLDDIVREVVDSVDDDTDAVGDLLRAVSFAKKFATTYTWIPLEWMRFSSLHNRSLLRLVYVTRRSDVKKVGLVHPKVATVLLERFTGLVFTNILEVQNINNPNPLIECWERVIRCVYSQDFGAWFKDILGKNKFCRLSMCIYHSSTDPEQQKQVLLDIANCTLKLREPSKAMMFHVYLWMAKTAKSFGDLDESETYAECADPYSLGDSALQAMLKNFKCSLSLSRGKPDEALTMARTACNSQQQYSKMTISLVTEVIAPSLEKGAQEIIDEFNGYEIMDDDEKTWWSEEE